jgi:tellurite resistance protein TehA-like permease
MPKHPQTSTPSASATSPRPASAKNPTRLASYRPLRPHPKLFVFLCIAFGLWVLFLIVLFCVTVYPKWHTLHPPLRPAPAAPMRVAPM